LGSYLDPFLISVLASSLKGVYHTLVTGCTVLTMVYINDNDPLLRSMDVFYQDPHFTSIKLRQEIFFWRELNSSWKTCVFVARLREFCLHVYQSGTVKTFGSFYYILLLIFVTTTLTLHNLIHWPFRFDLPPSMHSDIPFTQTYHWYGPCEILSLPLSSFRSWLHSYMFA